jgi:acylaminoacyl-peptidase
MDLRVPKSQGIEYHHVLRAQGSVCKMIHFPEDTHAIDKPLSEASHWVAIADWIDQHMP